MMEWLMKWMYYWAETIDGLIGVLTLGFVTMHLSLYQAKRLARCRYKKEGQNGRQ